MKTNETEKKRKSAWSLTTNKQLYRSILKKIKSYPRATDIDNNLNLYEGGESTKKKAEFLISFPKLWKK